MAVNRCSECGASLADKRVGAKTCSPKCRSTRSRRIDRQRRGSIALAAAAKAYPEHMKVLAEGTDPNNHKREVRDAVHDVLEQELRPVVRESITEDTLRAIQKMVGLTPRVVELIAADLESTDATIRQRAYTLVTKYTMGHQAIVTTGDTDKNQQIVVNFALPRPGQAPLEAQAEVIEGTVDEGIQQCDQCGEDQPLSSFVAGSQRCLDCFEARQREVQERFDTDAT